MTNNPDKLIKQLILWAARTPKSKESQIVLEMISYIESLEKEILELNKNKSILP